MHKFKLKKDDEVVGHLRIKDGWIQFQDLNSDNWYFPCNFHYDTAHPFVCLDKNEKEVYAGDKIGIIDNGELLELGIVEFVRFQWCIKRPIRSTGKHYYDRLETFYSDIELIKE